MRTLLLVFWSLLVLPVISFRTMEACSISAMPSVPDLIGRADAIIVGKAFHYAVEPDPAIRTTGVPAAVVQFEVEEILRGTAGLSELALHGYLSSVDDFNDRPAPYDFVRRNGRKGSCYANTYRQGASFLLFLKVQEGGFTVNWSPLAPANEQLRGDQDPWLMWVKGFLAGKVSV